MSERDETVKRIGAGGPSGAGEDARREGLAASLRRWCERAAVPGPVDDLSDTAAMLVASGRAGPQMRSVMMARVRAGVGTPSIGDYTGLRSDVDRLRRLESMADAPTGGTRALVAGRRADVLRRRLRSLRSTVVASSVVHGGGVRGMRRERREGVHLAVEQREHLFTLLCWTPAPFADNRGRAAEFGYAAVADLAGLVTQRAGRVGGTVPSAARKVEQWAGQGQNVGADSERRFRDGYETLVYLAATYFDRIRSSDVWASPEFAVQRGQVDIADELARLSCDAAELQTLRAELDAARAAAGGGSAAFDIDERVRVLGPVWTQLLDRLVSLARIAEAMAYLDAGLRADDAAVRAASLDDRIDSLVGRSGGHELVTEGLHRFGEDIESGGWGVIGYRSQVVREIEELTARHR